MVYFDIRPSAHLPTVELRVCDACPQVDDVVLIAGLFRALVGRAREELRRAGCRCRHPPRAAAGGQLAGGPVRAGGRPGRPRSARAGRAGDPDRPAGATSCARSWRRSATGSRSWSCPRPRWRRGSARGPAAPGVRAAGRADRRGRRAARRHPGPRPRRSTPPATVPSARAARRLPRRPGSTRRSAGGQGAAATTAGCSARWTGMGPRGLAAAESALHTEQRARGVTFRVGDGEPDRLFPLDLVPRIVTAEDWAGLTAGLDQRVRALEAFLRDVYTERQIVADGVMPASVVDDAPGWSRLGKLVPPDAVRIAVAGIDLVRDRADRWLVLEDNLRVPSGIGVLDHEPAADPQRDARSGAAGRRRRPGGGAGPAARRPCSRPSSHDRAGRRRGRPALRGPGRLGLLRAPAAGRPDGRAGGHPARPAGHRRRGVPRRRRRADGGCRRCTGASTSAPCWTPRAPTCGRSAGRSATRAAGATSRCSTRWATAWPTTSSSTPTSPR